MVKKIAPNDAGSDEGSSTGSVDAAQVAQNCLCPCIALAINEGILISKYPDQVSDRQNKTCCVNVLLAPFCGPCCATGWQHVHLQNVYDFHLGSPLPASAELVDDASFFKPPPPKQLSCLYAFFCYACALERDQAHIRYLEEKGLIKYSFEPSYNEERSARGFDPDRDPLKTFAIIGLPQSGKTTLYSRLLNKGLPDYDEVASTTKYANYGCKALYVQDGEDSSRPVFFNFLDVPADTQAESIEAASALALKEADCIILVFDCTSRDSFLAVENAVQELQLRAHEEGKPLPPVILVGNFLDVAAGKCLFEKDVLRFVERHKRIAYVSCSARTGEGVGEVTKQGMEMTLGGTKMGVVAEAMER
ncbi:hypothetical protein TrST_g10400 [Triparma strigata]|uniref:Uncharacterized protein n=1 Tax=Triparma strigata TaxID=1606541 RepID=A0A9W7C4F2_9STRA|nr:hypothetical protein TrST_g10400 [Triparma strigata]